MFYDVARSLYLETDASSISLEAGLLQVKDGMNCGHNEKPDNAILQLIAFASKRLLSAEWHSSNIECEGLGILQGLENFTTSISWGPLVAILSKDVAMLSQWLQWIMHNRAGHTRKKWCTGNPGQ